MSPSPPSARSGALLTTIFVVQFLVSLDVALLNIALPSIQNDLGFTDAGLQWVVNAYLLTFAGFMLLGGRLGDLWGRRQILVVGLVAFFGFSLWGALATGPAELIAARAGQGVAGALISPASLALITTHFTEGKMKARALGLWGGAGAGGGAVGVVLSGVLSEYFGWRAVLLVNLPIAALALIATLRGVPRRAEKPAAGSLDVPGAVLVTAGMASLILGINLASENGWGDAPAWIAFAAAAVLLAAFVLVEAKAPRPLMPLYVFGIRSVLGANLFGFMLSAGQLASFYFVSLYVQQVWGTDAQIAGVMFLPFCVFVVVGIQVATRLSERFGPRIALFVLGIVGAAGLAWFALLQRDGTFLTGMLGPSVLGGVGIGGTMVVLGQAATAGVPARDAGVASGVLNSSRQLGGTLGLAVLVSIAANASSASTVADPVTALGTGYTTALGVAAALLAVGAVIALAIIPRRAVVAPTAAEPAREG